jgi:hypothetical protein
VFQQTIVGRTGIAWNEYASVVFPGSSFITKTREQRRNG